MRELPSYYGSRVNNTTLELQFGSITFGTSPTCQPITNLSEFIAQQDPNQPGLYSKQEPSVRTLWPDFEMMVSPLKLIVHSATPKNIAVRQSKSLEDQEVGKQFAPLWKVLSEKLEVLFPEGDGTGTFIVPALDARSQVLSIKDRRNGVGKPEFKLAPFWKRRVSCLHLLHLWWQTGFFLQPREILLFMNLGIINHCYDTVDLFRASVPLPLCYVGSWLSLFSPWLHFDLSPICWHSSWYALRKVSPVGIQNACICSLLGEVTRLGSKDAGVATLPSCFRIILNGTVEAVAFCLVLKHLLGCDDKCMLSVPSSTNDLNSRWQSGEICQELSTGLLRCFATCMMVQWTPHSQCTLAFCIRMRERTFYPPFPLSCSCPAHAVDCWMFPVFWAWHCVFHAPVCCCHRDSLTRWRLGLAQEAARGASSSSSLLFFLDGDVPFDFWQLARNVPSREVDVWRSCFPRNVAFHTLCNLHVASLTVLDRGARKVHPQWLAESDSHELPQKRFVGLWLFVYMRGYFQAKPPFGRRTFVFVTEFPHVGWVCQWKPFWIPVGGSFQKAHLEEWIYMWWFFRRTRFCEFSCACAGPWQQRLHLQIKTTWWCTSSTQTRGTAWCSYMGATWAPRYCILVGKNGGTIASFRT